MQVGSVLCLVFGSPGTGSCIYLVLGIWPINRIRSFGSLGTSLHFGIWFFFYFYHAYAVILGVWERIHYFFFFCSC